MIFLNKAVFLDRDGVVNHDTHHISPIDDWSKFKFIGGSAEAVCRLSKEFKIIIIANLARIEKGIIAKEDALRVNERLAEEIERMGGEITKIYCCSHRGVFADGKEIFERSCHYRKPNPGMIEKAMMEFDVDVNKSWLVGDKTSDIKTAENAGGKIRTILVKTGEGGKDRKCDVKPDYTCVNLAEAAELIISRSAKG